jgi:hypothetical protein
MTFSESPPARVRPGPVNLAVYGLLGLAVISLVSVILQIAVLGRTVDAARDYAGGTEEGDLVVTFTQIFGYIFIAISLLFVVGYALLAVFDRRGSNVARIISWVVLGLSLCCGVTGLASSAGGTTSFGNDPNSSIDQEELMRRMQDAAPDWYAPLTLLLGIVSLLAAVGVIILLALPASNEYFRKQPTAVWEPPVPGATYPPAPGQSGQSDPGYPPPPAT